MTLDILSIFAAIALHKLAHVIAALCLGVKVKRFDLCWRGVYIVREAGIDRQNLLISLAGPLSNFVAAYISLFVFRRGAIFCAMSLVTGVINLLPLPCSDELRVGRITHSRLSSELKPAAVAVTECRPGDSVKKNSEQQERRGSSVSCGLRHSFALLASFCYVL
jgi:hypothetical protein